MRKEKRRMQAIEKEAVQQALYQFVHKDVFFHLETSTGSYRELEEPGGDCDLYVRQEWCIEISRGKNYRNWTLSSWLET
ncbi:DUF1806 family protein [Virgibacillus halophilus]|uniref:DUF1806 family protein n=1 Tax=Tigheibacillus halophilus TaxID=361280 RepID=A0ABU5C224_9BACI|nr:DUF1806 family protein [Virgibacillus halophilus]